MIPTGTYRPDFVSRGELFDFSLEVEPCNCTVVPLPLECVHYESFVSSLKLG